MKLQILYLSLLFMASWLLYSAEQTTDFSQLGSQPDNVLATIVKNLGDADLVRFSTVSRRFNQIVQNERINRRAYIRYLWSKGEIIKKKFHAHEWWIHSLFFSDDGKLISVGLFDNKIKVWKANSYTLERQITNDIESFPKFTAFSSASNILAIYHEDDTITIWDVQTGNKLRQLNLEPEKYSLALSPDGTMMAAGSYKKITIWDLTTGNSRTIESIDPESYSGRVIFLQFSRSGQRLVSYGVSDHNINIWNVKTLANEQKFQLDETLSNFQIILLRSGRLLIAHNISADKVLFENVATKRPIATIPYDDCAGIFNHQAAWSYEGILLASATSKQKEEPTINLWNFRTKQTVQTFGNDHSGTALAFSGDDAQLAAGFIDGFIIIWKPKIDKK